MSFLVEDLVVYQKSVDLADIVLARVEDFPKGYGFLANQLSRAAVSIPANLAEGNGRFTAADRRNFFAIARGSLQECVPLLELAKRRALISSEDHAMLSERLEEIGRMLAGLISGVSGRTT